MLVRIRLQIGNTPSFATRSSVIRQRSEQVFGGISTYKLASLQRLLTHCWRVCRYRSGETVNFPQADFWPGTTSGLPVIWELSKDVLQVTMASDMASFGANSAGAGSETCCATTGSRAPIFLIAVAVHLMRRRSGLVLSRKLCALTPRTRTEV